MNNKWIMGLVVGLLLSNGTVQGQSVDLPEQRISNLPSKFCKRIQDKTAGLDRQLCRQTEKYLEKMARREARLRHLLSNVDPATSQTLFGGVAEQYAAFAQQIRQDTGSSGQSIGGEYQPYTDSLRGMLGFLQQKIPGQNLAAGVTVKGAQRQLQTLQAKMQDADQVRDYIRQRKEQIHDYISQHGGMAGALDKDYQSMKEDLYSYSQSVRQYKEILNDPDKLEQKALNLLNKLPAFQDFMKQHCQLARLFNLPSNYGSPEALAGLQTRDEVSALIQGRVVSAGAGGPAALQSSMQAARSKLQSYKEKLNQLGRGSGDIEMPDFTPNDQKTKTFWKRLEYGVNFQTAHNSAYFPTVSDFGLSVGYRCGTRITISIGGSYKLGWGNGINHIAFTSQGIGLRSGLDVKIGGSFFATGGFEYNRTVPFRSMQQLHQWDQWNRSGLLGISKTVSMKSLVFKKTRLQLLWDFLSYSQVPKTQAIVFRVSYML